MLSQDFAVAALAERLLQSEEGDIREAMVKELGNRSIDTCWWYSDLMQEKPPCRDGISPMPSKTSMMQITRAVRLHR